MHHLARPPSISLRRQVGALLKPRYLWIGWNSMNLSGDDNVLKEARSALIDALQALREHKDSVIVIGAQAIYLHTGAANVALAEATKDSDLALDARSLGGDPLIEQAMRAADF